MPRTSTRIRTVLLWLVFASLAAACGPALTRYREVQFPSGRVIKLFEMGPVETRAGPAWQLRYQADAPFEDPVAVRAEALAVWSDFRLEAEAAGVGRALLNAMSPEAPGWDRSRSSLQFLVERRDAGDWEFVSARGGVRHTVKASDLNSMMTHLEAR